MELDAILAVALKHFAKRGYHAATVRAIARDVGVTIPALYYHYDSKQHILVALLDFSMNIVEQKVAASVDAAGDDPRAQLVNLTEALSLYMANYRELAFLDSEIRSLEGENRQVYAERRDRLELLLRSILQRGQEQGIFSTYASPSDISRALLSAIQGIAVWFRMDGPDTPEVVAQKYARLALALAEAGD
ncbi:TetR/AcrR family transcriptional regulator [Corynebacterium sp. HMSC071B10]|uniref:TetR/AcrR family transcriptional regulator n=1 Tax=Corynebacterium sp. HMSC071B10 TaxID=1739494 RepID=UPI000A8A4899|nr:TetR/AcrR family transcriptional regulator [Corynebacterium sp. HMSC071B10]